MFVISPRGLAAISRLPSLTQLLVNLTDAAGGEPTPIDLAGVGRLTRLEALHLMANQRLDAPQVVAAVKTCTSIRSLALDDVRQLTDAHLCDLLPSLTALRRLELRLRDQLADLSCLSVASNLAGTLEHLHIESRSEDGLPPHALLHLRSLRRLQSARLRLTSRRTDHTGDIVDSDSTGVYLPMLENLHMSIDGEGGVDLHGMLGRLPQLSVANLQCDIGIDLTPLELRGRRTRSTARRSANLAVRGGHLYHGDRLYIPNDTALRTRLMLECHDTPLAGHLGVDKTIARQNSPQWKGLLSRVGTQIFVG